MLDAACVVTCLPTSTELLDFGHISVAGGLEISIRDFAVGPSSEFKYRRSS